MCQWKPGDKSHVIADAGTEKIVIDEDGTIYATYTSTNPLAK